MSIETILNPYHLHVLVCTNVRVATADGLPPDGTPAAPLKASCGPLGAELVRAELKEWLRNEVKQRPKLVGKLKFRVNGSGCLDFCKKGIVIALYPQSDFMFFVKNSAESLAEVKNNILRKLADLESKIGS